MTYEAIAGGTATGSSKMPRKGKLQIEASRRPMSALTTLLSGFAGATTRNTAVAFAGTTMASVLSLGALALTARALGVAAFGWFVLFRTYALLVDKLVNFQSWQAVVRYGAGFVHAGDAAGLKRLLKACALLDFTTAMAGWMVACCGIVGWGLLRGWSTDLLLAGALATGAVGLNWIGSPNGVLRLFDRYAPIAVHQTVLGVLQLTVAITGFLVGLGLLGFVAGWLIAGVLADGLLFTFAFRELRRNGHRDVWRARVGRLRDTAPGLWSFLVSTNLSTAVRITSREADTLLVGGLLGVSAAGIYKVAKQFASLVGRVADPIDMAIYPALARAWMSGDGSGFKQVLRSGLLLGTGAALTLLLALVFLGRPLLYLTVGPEYSAAFGIMLVYSVGILLGAATASLHPALIAMGRPDECLRIIACATAAYFAALLVLLPRVGLYGAAVAYSTFFTVWIPWMTVSIRRETTKARSTAWQAAPSAVQL